MALSANAAALIHEVRTELLMAMADQPDEELISTLVTQVDSKSRNETYGWIGGPPVLEELTDEIHMTPASNASVTLTNREFTMGIEFKKSDIEDDRTGMIKQRVAEMVDEARDHRYQLILDTIVANGTGYDGAAFFADAHPARGAAAAQDNNLAGTGTTTAAISTDIASAIARLKRLLDERGRPVNRRLTEIGIVAPPDLERAFREAVESPLISNTGNAQVKGIIWHLFFDGSLSDVNDWYLFNAGKRLKPVILQNRVSFEPDEIDQKKSQSIQFIGRVRYAAMLSAFTLGVRTTN